MLAGVRVVETTTLLPGPFAGRRLLDLGADVAKVEPPGGDPVKHWNSDGYEALNGDKEVVEIDLTTEDGQSRFQDRVGDADAVVTANRPSTLAKLGLTAPDLHDVRDDLVVVQLLGHSDPERAGHDLTYQVEAGLVGPDDGLPPVTVADLAAAERVATHAVAGLFHRERTGQGSVSRVVAEEVAASWATANGPVVEILRAHPGYDIYACADAHLALACLSPKEWKRLCRRLDEPDWIDRPDGVREALADRLAERPAEAWIDDLDGLPVAVVGSSRP